MQHINLRYEEFLQNWGNATLLNQKFSGFRVWNTAHLHLRKVNAMLFLFDVNLEN